jgi:hypothetical protein
MLDRDLAALYGVETKVLKRAVRRNLDRFPEDFMFVLSRTEFTNWRRQFGTSKADRQGLRYPPMAFTEHGIVMLSSVLNSQRAIDVNIESPARLLSCERSWHLMPILLVDSTNLKRSTINVSEQSSMPFERSCRLLRPSVSRLDSVQLHEHKNAEVKLCAPSFKRCFILRLPNLRQHFLRFASLPLRIVETLARLPEVHLAETCLRILDRAQGEVQPLTRLTQPVEL